MQLLLGFVPLRGESVRCMADPAAGCCQPLAVYAEVSLPSCLCCVAQEVPPTPIAVDDLRTGGGMVSLAGLVPASSVRLPSEARSVEARRAPARDWQRPPPPQRAVLSVWLL